MEDIPTLGVGKTPIRAVEVSAGEEVEDGGEAVGVTSKPIGMDGELAEVSRGALEVPSKGAGC